MARGDSCAKNLEAKVAIMSDGFERFGDIKSFAFDVRMEEDPDVRSASLSSIGSWGAWRLWVAGNNLCSVEFSTRDGVVTSDFVRWYLAPLFCWMSSQWTPLLHEGRVPQG